ncbi:MAG: hypothetical protein NZM28_01000 [Fimbriimonadales bacterium]|nr:hypothetical protein [Fimbriimonadales bacterium]
MKQHAGLATRLALMLLTVLGALTVGATQQLTWLGVLPDFNQSVAYAVSADGAVVVGEVRTGPYSWDTARAFRWTRSTGMQNLGSLGSGNSSAYGVSADGAVVVGGASGSAFRWTAQQGMQSLGRLQPNGGGSVAYGVSADGAVVVGNATNWRGDLVGFYWTAQSGMGSLSMLMDADWSEARGVSANGIEIVGSSGNSSFWQGWSRAVRMTPFAGMLAFGTLGGPRAEGYAVSADGQFFVGRAQDRNNAYRAFVWTWSEGTRSLGTLPGGYDSVAYGVSSGGVVIVGAATNAEFRTRAFRWTAATGMQDLNLLFSNLLDSGSELHRAYAVSPDGRYIVGVGYNGASQRIEAFLLDTNFSCLPPRRGDVDGNGCTDDADLISVLFQFGASGTALGRVDTNCDGVVDDADLLTVLFNFGAGC